MKTLPVRLLDLAAALEDHGGELWVYYFDTRSGEVLFLSQDQRGYDKCWKKISNSFGRFIKIEPMSSRKGYEIMEEFVNTLPASRLREKLQWSLHGAKPFRRFKDTINQDPTVRQQWLEFHGAAMSKIATEWLAERDIQPVEPDASGAVESLQAGGLHPDDIETEENDDVEDEDLDEVGYEEEEDDSEEGELDEFDEFEDSGVFVEPLSEEEEAELADFVESLPDAEFSVAKLHGLLSAFAAGPATVTSEEILKAITGSTELPKPEDSLNFDSNRILELLGRFYDSVSADLESEDFAPQFQQQGVMVTNAGRDLVSWCQGFVLGIQHHQDAWQSWFNDVRRSKAISLLMGMAQPEILEKMERTTGATGEETAWTTWSMMSELVPLIRDYWRFESALSDYLGPQPDNPELKVVRDDPCPVREREKVQTLPWQTWGVTHEWLASKTPGEPTAEGF